METSWRFRGEGATPETHEQAVSILGRPSKPQSGMIYTFEDFELDTDRYELRRAGAPVAVEPQVFDVLVYLVEHGDRVVAKQELFENVWKTRFVTDSALTSRIKAARRAVGDDGRSQRLIATAHGRGYRFLSPVAERRAASPGEGEGIEPVLVPTWLVGRQDDLDALRRRMGEVRSGRRRTVVITGGAGLGKTTLIEAFLGELGSGPVAVAKGYCLERQGVGEPYMPILEAINRLCRQQEARAVDILARRAPTWLAQMPWLIPEGERDVVLGRTIGATPGRMLREFVEAMGAFAAEQPLIFVLDDLQWSDPSTLDALGAVARSPDPAPILILCSCRAAELADPGHPAGMLLQDLRLRGACEVLALRSLSKGEVEAYLETRLEVSVPEEAGRKVHATTGGNPLYMKALVVEWMTRGTPTPAGDPSPGTMTEVPDSLRQIIELRLGRLTPAHQSVLEAAAVAGMKASAGLIATVLGRREEEIEVACQELVRGQEFLRSPREPSHLVDSLPVEFVHSIYREALYERVPAARRARLHGAVARGLESLEAHAPRDDLVNDLAWHYTEARDAPRAVPYLAMAAGAALRRGAYREAVGHIETGLRLGEGSSGAGLTELRIDLQDMLAIARVMGEGWGHPDIEPSLEKALSLCTELDDPQRRSVILYHLGAVYEGRGQHEKSQALLEQRLELESSGSDSTPLLESHELLACSMFHQGGFEGSLSHAETGWSLYDPERHLALVASAAGDNLGVSCMCWAALDLWSLGHADKAAERMAQALKLAGDPSHSYCLARAHEQTATLHQLRREPDVVLRHATATIDLSLERGYDLRAVSGAMLRGWARVHLGDPEGGLAELQEGLDDYLQSGADINVPHFVGLLADAWLQTGNFENCLKTVARALGAMLTSSFYYEPELHRLDGLARIGLGALDPGRESLRRAVDIARTQKARFFELRAASAIARHAPNGDERKQALTSLGSVYGGFKDTSVTPDLVEAKALLAG